MFKIVNGKLKLHEVPNPISSLFWVVCINYFCDMAISLIDGNNLLDLNYQRMFYITFFLIIFIYLWNFIIKKFK